VKIQIMGALQSLTGKYRDLQRNPCNENRDPAMRTEVPCNENRFFPAGIDLQGALCKPYRVWVYSVGKVCLRCKDKTLLGVVNKLFNTTILLTSPSNVLLFSLK
jgi:hypothetical protein